MPRATIAAAVSIEGTGLHTGCSTRVTCRPAPPGRGIIFRRSDLPGAPEIPARVESVRATERRTALGTVGAGVETVEHLMAAVYAREIDDLIVDLDGPELPILDGSFAPFFALLSEAGSATGAGEPGFIRPEARFAVSEGDSHYEVRPGRGLSLHTTIEWDHPLIGRQSGSWKITPTEFATELAPARTFGFLHEVEQLRKAGLLRGGSLESAVVLSEDGVVGTTLRWPDEFLRHKTGDILGDLALAGARIEARIAARRPSHQGNVAVVRALLQTTTASGGRMLDIKRIMEVLPHRYPFLLVDRIVELEPGRRAVGIKNVTINEPFFPGHFPGHPIMPGVLIVEAMAQTGGMLLADQLTESPGKVVYFMAIDRVKFRKPVIPGDQLRLEVEVIQIRGINCRMKGVARVEGKVVAEGELLACVMDR